MSESNSDLTGIAEFICDLISNNGSNMNMSRNNKLIKKKPTIVKIHKKLNWYLSTIMGQDQCSSDTRSSIANCSLFTILLMKFNPKYSQVKEISESFNVKTGCGILIHYCNITVKNISLLFSYQYGMLCLCILHLTLLAIVLLHTLCCLSRIQNETTM